MIFIYLFLFAFSFLFSSDEFYVKWKGLDIDLSLCNAIKDFTYDAHGFQKEIFKKFPFPSKKSKNRQYLKKLFNPHFNYSGATTQLLVNLTVDRKALGFDQEIFLDPLLKAAIKKGLLNFSIMTCVLPDYDKKRKVEEYIKNSDNYFNVLGDCFEYLKTNMPERLPDYFQTICKEQIIESKPEWNELIAHDSQTFFNEFKDLNQNQNLNLNRLAILNSSINETLFELIKNFKNITLKNCFNLPLGKTDEQQKNVIRKIIFKKYFNEDRSRNNYFINCGLDESSFQRCQDISHNISMINCLSQSMFLIGLFWSIFDICCTIRSSDFGLRTFHLVACLAINFLLCLQARDFSFLYFVCATRIAYDLIPLVLKENCIFPFRLLSGMIIIGCLICNFWAEYLHSKEKMEWLMENQFGLFTKYAFLDRLCALYFGCKPYKDTFNNRN